MQKAVETESQGLILRGMLHLPEGMEGKAPLALIFHGFTGNKTESHFIFVKLSRLLAQRGIASLRFDFAGSGESDGAFADMTFSGEVEDAKAILAFAQRLPEVDRERIGVVGLSMGGAVASVLAGVYPQAIRALCLWAPAANMAAIVAEREKETPFQVVDGKECFELGGLLLGKKFIEDIKQLDIYRQAASYTGKVLLLHGEQDQAVPLQVSQRYQEVYGERARLKVVAGADHTFNRHDWEEEVLAATTAFLEQELCLSPGW